MQVVKSRFLPMIEFETLVFYFFATLTVLAALGVILTNNSVHAALFLVLSFIASACIWMLLHAEFLAIALVLVYVGAVMVLFIFVLMMLDIKVEKSRQQFWQYGGIGLGVALALIYLISSAVSAPDFLTHYTVADNTTEEIGNTRAIASLLYTEFVYPFELAAVLLLVAIIASVALTLRHRSTKKIDIAHQLAADPKERVRLVSMPPEKRPALTTEPADAVPDADNPAPSPAPDKKD